MCSFGSVFSAAENQISNNQSVCISVPHPVEAIEEHIWPPVYNIIDINYDLHSPMSA